MTLRRNKQHLWTCLLLAVGLGSSSGCLNCCHSLAAPTTEQTEPSRSISPLCRQCVHIFLLNGTDALGCANLCAVRPYLFALGFPQTYYGEVCDLLYFRNEIRRLHAEKPAAHFVLVGYDIGAWAACNLAQWVRKEGIEFDLVMYIDPLLLANDASCRPENAHTVINVVSNGGSSLTGVEERRVPDAGHYGVPTHSATLCLLRDQLLQIAGEATPLPPPVPVPVLSVPSSPPPTPPSLPPADEMAPPPRPVPPSPTAERDDWDFLKPATQMHPLTLPAEVPVLPSGDWQRRKKDEG